MATIQNFEVTPDKFKVRSVCLERNIEVRGTHSSKYTIYGDRDWTVWGRRKVQTGFGRKAYTKKTTWKNEMQMGE